LRNILNKATFGYDGSNLKHLASPFTVSCGDDGGVDVKESVVLEKLMSCEGKIVLYPGYCTHNLSSGPKMGNISEGFKVDLFSRKWVLIIVTFSIN